MKKQQKKAFTLVELLVVIAILAILASVAVVGYTAFIKNAAISNDENVATQMTRYLEALKADSTSKYYNKDITAGDVRELTKYILEESGSVGLEAESAKYGYDFYFDLEKDEYIVDKTENVRNAARNVIMGANAAETDIEVRLENSFTQSFRYFLASTGGSELASLINDFYALGNKEDIKGAIEELKEKAKETDIEAQMNALVVFTNDAISTKTAKPTVLVVVDGITKITAPSAEVDLSEISVITLPDSVVAVEEEALNGVGIVIVDKTPEEVSKMSTGSFAESMKLKGETTIRGDEITYNYSNKFDGFSVDKVSVSYEKVVETENNSVIYITPEIANGEIVVDVEYRNANSDPDMPILGVANLEWALKDGEGNVVSDAKLEKLTDTRLLIRFDKNYQLKDKYILVATTNLDAYTYELRVQKLTAGTVTLNGQTLEVGANNITLVTKNDVEKFNVAELAYTITNELDNIRLFNYDITMSCSGDGFSVDNDKDEFIVENPNKGTITGTLTINVGTYLTFNVNLTIVDARNFAIQPKNYNISVLGNENAINISELFELKGAFPEGTQLVVYTGGEGEGDTYMAFEPWFFEYVEITAGEEGDKVTGNGFTVTSDNFSKIALQFTSDSGANPIKIAFMHNGVRISEDIIVKVVDGWNIRNYSDIIKSSTTTTSSSTASGHNGTEGAKSSTTTSAADTDGFITKVTTTTTIEHSGANLGFLGDSRKTKTTITVLTTTIRENCNYVLLGDIAMMGSSDLDNNNATINDGTLTIAKGKTLYGNGFKFTLTHGRLTEAGIINLSGTIKDTKIVGNVYSEFAFRVGDNYGSSAICVKNAAAVIENCHISGCRSPLRVEASVKIKDSIFYGGRYSNIDLISGTVTIQGEVITVNQNSGNSVGTGITVWYSSSTDNAKISVEDGAKLTQYNFISKADKSAMPTILEVINLGDIFATLIDDPKYSSFVFADDKGDLDATNDVKYLNTGIVYINKTSAVAQGSISIPDAHTYKYTGTQYDMSFGSGTWLILDNAVKLLLGSNPFSNPTSFHISTLTSGETTNQELFEDRANAMTTYHPDNYQMQK